MAGPFIDSPFFGYFLDPPLQRFINKSVKTGGRPSPVGVKCGGIHHLQISRMLEGIASELCRCFQTAEFPLATSSSDRNDVNKSRSRTEKFLYFRSCSKLYQQYRD